MRHRALIIIAAISICVTGAAQMGMEMGMGRGQRTLIDMQPVWSPDGKHIAFTRGYAQQGGVGKAVKAGILPVGDDGDGKPTILPNLHPLAWTPDSSGLLCAFVASGSRGNPYSGIWRVDRDDTENITLVLKGTDPLQASYSPDGQKLLVVDAVAKKRHKLMVGPADGTPKAFYVTTQDEIFIDAGWTHTSEEIWLLIQKSGKSDVHAGDQLPEQAREQMGQMRMMGGQGRGMMEGGMMGGGMQGGMMGMRGRPKEKNVLYVIPLDGSDRKKIAEDIDACAWNPTKPQIVMKRTVHKKVKRARGMMMEGGMMGGGMEGGMMGPAMKEIEFMAVRNPYEGEKSERRFAFPTVPMKNFVWSANGEMVASVNGKQKRVFATDPLQSPIYEIAENFDSSIKKPDATAIAWSPDGKKIVYPAETKNKKEKKIITQKGLAIRAIDSPKIVQLTTHETKMPIRMGGMGMM